MISLGSSTILLRSSRVVAFGAHGSPCAPQTDRCAANEFLCRSCNFSSHLPRSPQASNPLIFLALTNTLLACIAPFFSTWEFSRAACVRAPVPVLQAKAKSMRSLGGCQSIHPFVRRSVRAHARKLFLSGKIPDVSQQDLEQDLYATFLPRNEKYDPSRSSYRTFVERAVGNCARRWSRRREPRSEAGSLRRSPSASFPSKPKTARRWTPKMLSGRIGCAAG